MATERKRATAKKTTTTRKRSSAPRAQVTLNGRFPAGARVALVEVSGENVLRSQGGKTIARKKVDDDGRVQFTTGVKVGARYFVVGRINGVHTEVRVTGRKPADDNAGLAQEPVRPDRTTTGIQVSPVPEGSEPVGGMRLAQEQVGDDVPQRSATATGTAHPVDPDERGPYPDQASELYSSGKVPQRSDTAAGMATPIADVPQRQEDIPNDVPQRSSTRTGVATPLPPGNGVEAVRGIESTFAKAAAGEPSQADMRGVTGESISSDGEPHKDRYEEDYEPVQAGEDPGEGRPESERKTSRRKR